VWIAVVFQSDVSVTFPEGAYVDDLLLHKCMTSCATLAASTGSWQSKTAMLTRP
jgi:hypothetical protein